MGDPFRGLCHYMRIYTGRFRLFRPYTHLLDAKEEDEERALTPYYLEPKEQPLSLQTQSAYFQHK